MSRAPKGFGLTFAACLALAACGVLHAATPPHARSTATTSSAPAAAPAPQAPASKVDHTLEAMHDEMQRSRDRLLLQTGDPNTPSRPYYIEYRLLDLDERTITAEFGALVSSTTSRNRFMSVGVRVGNYKVASPNFITSDGFCGFLGATGPVGRRPRAGRLALVDSRRLRRGILQRPALGPRRQTASTTAGPNSATGSNGSDSRACDRYRSPSPGGASCRTNAVPRARSSRR